MTTNLRVIVADDEPLLVEELSLYLGEIGHRVIATACTGVELIEKSVELKPDLIITDIKMPDMDGLDAAKVICIETPTPIVIVSAYHDEEYIEQASAQCIMAYLVKPIDETSLKTSILLARRRFREFKAMLKQNANLKEALENRGVIEAARRMLMMRDGLEEEAAFLWMQNKAADTGQLIVDVARSILPKPSDE